MASWPRHLGHPGQRPGALLYSMAASDHTGHMNEQPATVSVDDPHVSAWSELVRRTEHGETIAVLAHGEHVADVVPSGELERLRETIEVLSDTDLVRDLREGLADARACRVFSADDIAADLDTRRNAGE